MAEAEEGGGVVDAPAAHHQHHHGQRIEPVHGAQPAGVYGFVACVHQMLLGLAAMSGFLP
jgi:hypothetical protein